MEKKPTKVSSLEQTTEERQNESATRIQKWFRLRRTQSKELDKAKSSSHASEESKSQAWELTEEHKREKKNMKTLETQLDTQNTDMKQLDDE